MTRTAGRVGAAAALLAALLGAALLSTYWLGAGSTGTRPGDPTGRAPDGSAALAALLRDRGRVEIQVAASSEDLGEPAGTLLVAADGRLPDVALQRLAAAARTAATVVLVRPDGRELAALAPGVRREGSAEGELTAHCSSAVADPADVISGPTDLYTVPGSRAAACFPEPAVRHDAGGDPPGAVVSATGTAGQELLVIGSAALLTNARLAAADNAAVALRALGRHARLTWYTGALEPADVSAPDETAAAWPPRWLGPLTLGLLGTTVALMVWRGRRLGRLATEPLPVVVQAEETTLARGRLYRRAGDPTYAARILQQGAARRLAGLLRLPGGSDPRTIAEASARVAGRPAADVHAQLTRIPRDEADLAALAHALTELEGEVRRR